MERNRQQGSAFILSLAVMAVLLLVMVTAAARVRAESLSQRTRIEEARAESMALAAIARGMASLQTIDPNVTTETDEWIDLGQAGGEAFTVGRDSFRLQVLDAGAFINLNTAAEEQLQILPVTQEQIDSLLDWREAELTPRSLGAKDDYYNQLTTPYNTALRRLSTVQELLVVRGFTGATLYEPPTEETARATTSGAQTSQLPLESLVTVDSTSPLVAPDGSQKLNINTAQVAQLVQRGIGQQAAQAIINQRNVLGTYTTIGQVIQTPGLATEDFVAILDTLQVGTLTEIEGRINLNTASDDVLASIPGVTQDLVGAIAGRRGTFASLGELANLAGVTQENLAQFADAFTVGSNVFLVRAMGQAGSRRVFRQALVKVTDGVPKVVRIETPPFADMDQRWNWSEEAETRTILVEPQ